MIEESIRSGYNQLSPEEQDWYDRFRKWQSSHPAQARRLQRQSYFARSVGKRYARVTLDNYEITDPKQKTVVGALQRYVGNLKAEVTAGNGIVLFGPSGTGKDHLLIGMAKPVIDAGLSVVWQNGVELFSKLRDRISDNDETEADIVNKWTRCGILILSDPVPPCGGLSPYQAAMLMSVIDHRYRDCRPTWTTLNVAGGAEADERMGAPIVDRLKHGALCLHCDWPSYRRPQPEARS